MFFVFSKLFLFLIAPFSWIIVLLIVAVFTRTPARRRKFIIASFVMILFFSNTFIFDRFIGAWEIKSITDDKVVYYDAAIVLTGMATFDSKINRLEFNDRTDRLMQPIKLYKEKKIGKIILCGGPATISGTDTMEAGRLKAFLETIGIDGNDIIVEGQSRNTHENAVLCKIILTKIFTNGKFLLVSSGWHLKRAAACFIKEGIKVVPYSTDRYGGPVKFDPDYLFLPAASTLFNWEKLMHEWIGCLTYYIAGYI